MRLALLAFKEVHDCVDELLRLLLLRHVPACRQHNKLRPGQHRCQPGAVAHRDQGVCLAVDDEHLVAGSASQVSGLTLQASTRPSASVCNISAFAQSHHARHDHTQGQGLLQDLVQNKTEAVLNPGPKTGTSTRTMHSHNSDSGSFSMPLRWLAGILQTRRADMGGRLRAHRDVVLSHDINEALDLRQVLAPVERGGHAGWKGLRVRDARQQEAYEPRLPPAHQLRQPVRCHYLIRHAALHARLGALLSLPPEYYRQVASASDVDQAHRLLCLS